MTRKMRRDRHVGNVKEHVLDLYKRTLKYRLVILNHSNILMIHQMIHNNINNTAQIKYVNVLYVMVKDTYQLNQS